MKEKKMKRKGGEGKGGSQARRKWTRTGNGAEQSPQNLLPRPPAKLTQYPFHVDLGPSWWGSGQLMGVWAPHRHLRL